MAEEPKKAGRGAIVKGVGLGGMLMAVLGFLGDQTWDQFCSMREGVQALSSRMANVEGRLDDRDQVTRENDAQWRALTKADERLDEVYIRVRVVEELIRYHDALGDARLDEEPEELGAIPPPPEPKSIPEPDDGDQGGEEVVVEELQMAPQRQMQQRALLDEVRALKAMKRDPREYRDNAMRQQPANMPAPFEQGEM